MGKLILPPLKLVILGVVVSCGASLQLGYLLAILNPTKFVLQPFVNGSFAEHYGSPLTEPQFTTLWSFLVSSYTAGSMIGAILLHPVAERLGRRNGILWCVLGSLTLAALGGSSAYANSWEMYIGCRLLMGITVGLSVGLQSLYLSEVAPKKCRGFMSTLTAVGCAITEPTAALLGLRSVLGSSELWPAVHFVQIPFMLITLLFLARYPESPKELFARGQEQEARQAIALFHGPKANVDEVIWEIQTELKASNLTLGQVMRLPTIRKAVIVSSLISFGSGFSGGIIMLFYASSLLEEMGLSEDAATMWNIPVTGMVFTSMVIMMFVIDHVGRRKLLIFGTFFLGLINCAAVVLGEARIANPDKPWIGYLFLVDAILLLLAFGCSVGGIALFAAAELTPQNARSAATGVSIFVRNLSMLAAGTIFFPLNESVGGFAFLLFAIPMFLIALYLYFNLPETKDKSYPEIVQAWDRLPKLCCLRDAFAHRRKIFNMIV